jgi:hypothetical protein
MIKKINVLLALAIALAGMFSACELDTRARFVVKFVDRGNEIPDLYVDKGGTIGDRMPVLPERQGLVFFGWYDNQTRYDADTIISRNVTLESRWSDDIVTVKFEFSQTDDKGNVIMPTIEIPDVTAFRDLPLGPTKFPVTPRARGWEFVAWVLDGEDFTIDSPVPDDITLVAYWLPKKLFKVELLQGPQMDQYSFDVYAGDCIDEWVPAGTTLFPPDPQDFTNPVNSEAFFVKWLDDENREYDGRTPITRNLVGDSKVVGRWGLPPHIVNFQTEIAEVVSPNLGVEGSNDYGPGTNPPGYDPEVREAWDSTPENPKWVIVNNVTYDIPNNPNRWRILYRIKFNWPSTFDTGFYTRYTIRARFYANKQGKEGFVGGAGVFTPGTPAEESGYSEKGWLKKTGYDKFEDDGVTRKEISRSDDGWGQISWTIVPNWNGGGADAETLLQRYNLDRKGGTINDSWQPLRGSKAEKAKPAYLLIQTSDNYIGHIEITEIVFHNGKISDDPLEDEWIHTAYVDEEKPEPTDP